jgi:hypothetical protein
LLQQKENGNADPRKAVLTGLSGTPDDIYARVRIDSSPYTGMYTAPGGATSTYFEGEYARAGVGLYTSPATGQGYSLVMTGRWSNIDPTHPVHLEFLNDGVGWSGWLVNGSQTTLGFTPAAAPKIGEWWWFHMRVSNGILYGNAWKDPNQNAGASTPIGNEPSGWMITYNPASQGVQSQWNRTSGSAALVGSSTGTFTLPDGTPEPASGGAVSFADVTVTTV